MKTRTDTSYQETKEADGSRSLGGPKLIAGRQSRTKHLSTPGSQKLRENHFTEAHQPPLPWPGWHTWPATGRPPHTSSLPAAASGQSGCWMVSGHRRGCVDGRAQEGPARAVSSPGATQNPYMTGESQEYRVSGGRAAGLGRKLGPSISFPPGSGASGFNLHRTGEKTRPRASRSPRGQRGRISPGLRVRRGSKDEHSALKNTRKYINSPQ